MGFLVTQSSIAAAEARASERAAVIELHGALNGASYQKLVDKVLAILQEGVSRIIINLANVHSVNRAGIASLYMVGGILEGRAVSDQDGWAVYKQMDIDLEQNRTFERLVLVAPNEEIASVLRAAGLDKLVPTLSSMEKAIAAMD
jgi:anti-anti-sigma regulatory factor